MANAPVDSGYKYILAYGVAIAIIIFIMKFKAGYAAVYYCLVLSLLLVVLVEGKFIASSLAPISNTSTA